MVKYVVVFAVALLAIHGAVAKPKQAEQSQLEVISNNAKKVVDDVTATLKKDIPDSKKVVQILETNAQALSDSVTSTLNTIKTGIKDSEGNIDSLLKQFETKLTEASTNLKAAVGPAAADRATEIKNNLDKGYKEVLASAENFLKDAKPQADKMKSEVAKAASNLLDQLAALGEKVNKEIKANIDTKH